jgi:hypothetical protein
MSNEFKIKNGLIVDQGGASITGSVNIKGDVSIAGTASISYLNVTYESASVIYSSGSNQLGDATNDTQTLIGRTIVSGSFETTGSGIFTGNLTVNPSILSYGGDNAYILRSYNTSAGSANQFNIIHNLSDVNIINQRGKLYFGSNGSTTLTLDNSQNAIFTGSIEAGGLIRRLQTTTSAMVIACTNLAPTYGREIFIGVESSTGGTLLSGTSAYDIVVGSQNAGNLHLGTTGVVALTIDTSGNVGIGTTTPTAGKLQIQQSSNTLNNGITIVDSTASRSLRLWADNTYMYIQNGNGSGIQLDNSGNVGIGTSTPLNLLHLKGAAGTVYQRFEASVLIGLIGEANGLITAAASNTMAVRSENGLYLSGAGDAKTLYLDSSNNATFGGNVTIQNYGSLSQLNIHNSHSTISEIIDFTYSQIAGDNGNAQLRFYTKWSGYTNLAMYLDAPTNTTSFINNVGIGGAPYAFGGGYRGLTINGQSGGQGGYIHFSSAGTTYADIYTNSSEIGYQTSAGIQHSFYVGSSSAMVIDASRNVGIGTSTFGGYATSGRGMFAVNGSASSMIQLQLGGTVTGYLYTDTNTYLHAVAGNMYLQQNGNNVITIDTSQRVGIGTTTPSMLFQVSTRAGIDSSGVVYWGSALTGNNRGALTWDTNKAIVYAPVALSFNVAGYEALLINNSLTAQFNGDVGIGTYPTGATNTRVIHINGVSGSIARFTNDLSSTHGGYIYGNTSGMSYVTNLYHSFTAGGGTHLYISGVSPSSGYVGIGTTTPTSPLHIVEEIRIDQTGTAPGLYTSGGGNTIGQVYAHAGHQNNNVLGEPDVWLQINVNGTQYAFPGYLPG